MSLSGAQKPPKSVSIQTQMLAVTVPQRLTRIMDGRTGGRKRRAYLHSAGATGYRVLTYRVFGSNRRESLSDDTYPAMNRVIALNRGTF